MTEIDESSSYRGGLQASYSEPAAYSDRSEYRQVAFNRRELNEILNVYGRKVAEGEWRDYAIDLLKEKAVFSIFRRTSEVPLFRIVKDPKLARRQGAYSVIAPGGMILKRGPDLSKVLRVLDHKRHLRAV